MRKVWFLSIPGFVRGFIRQCDRWTTVLEINHRACDFHPAFLGNPPTARGNNGLHPFDDDSICSFSDAILVWEIWCCSLVFDADFKEIFTEFLLVFPSAVCA